MLGYDTVYETKLSDPELVELAIKEDRILLTRDTALAKNASAKTLHVLSTNPEEQLQQVTQAYNLNTEMALTRCTLCNSPLTKIKKEDYQDQIPSKAYEFYQDFSRCEKCGKIYWKGTHIERLKNKKIL